MKPIYIILICIAAIAALVGISFGMGYINVGYTKTVVKAQTNANREVYEQSASYVEGKIEELTKYRLEYNRSKDPQDKAAIASMLVQDFANFDESKLSPELYQFLESIKNN